MEKIGMTNHIIEDRMDRVVKIATTIGFGEIVCKAVRHDTGTLNCITNTGVVIVKSLDGESLITMYVATYKQADAIFHGAGVVFTQQMKAVVKRNEKKWF